MRAALQRVATTVSPLVGYNDNIRYGGSTYHVQTEDSGPRRPHVITHLFADGGRIVSSTKTSYEEYVSAEDVGERVRNLMRGQHKAMLAALQTGEFDEKLGSPGGATPQAAKISSPEIPRPEPPPPDDGRPATESAVVADRAEPLPLTTAVRGGPAVAGAAVPPVDEAPPREPEVTESDAADAEIDEEREAVRTQIGRRKPTTQPEVVPPVGSSVPVELLEKAAEEAERGFYRGIQPTSKDDPSGAARRPRKPTPIAGAGSYRILASAAEASALPDTEAQPAEPNAPPRKRRYPQTSPGRRQEAAARAATEAENLEEGAARRLQFGERFLTNRTLDKIILEVLSR